MRLDEICSLTSEIRELEGMLEIFIRNPAVGRSMSMSRWGRQTVSFHGIEEELSAARTRLRALDPSNPLADDSRTEKVETR